MPAAQSFPSKVVRLMVPFPAGGSNDVVARALSQPLSKALDQSVMVEKLLKDVPTMIESGFAD